MSTNIEYVVKSGNTLSGIAQEYNMTLEQLLNIAGNQQFVSNPDLIHPGDNVDVFKRS